MFDKRDTFKYTTKKRVRGEEVAEFTLKHDKRVTIRKSHLTVNCPAFRWSTFLTVINLSPGGNTKKLNYKLCALYEFTKRAIKYKS